MAPLSPSARNAATPPCAECNHGARTERCAACLVGVVKQVIARCDSTALAERLAHALADFMSGRRPLEARFGLTCREARVAQLLAEGHPNKEIARLLYISPHTARHHTQHVMLKLGARSRTAAAALILGV